MKIYDTINRRSYTILPEDVNIGKTKRLNDGNIYLHVKGGNMPYRFGYLVPSQYMYKKICTKPRTKW